MRLCDSAIVISVICLVFTNRLQRVECQRNEGEQCTAESTGAAGICKLLSSCQSAMKDIREKGVFPSLCGTFVGTVPVICCFDTVVSVTPTSTPRPTARTTTTPRPIPTTRPTTRSTPSATPPTPPPGPRQPGDISKSKCQEYAQLIYVNRTVPTLLFGPPKKITETVCTFTVKQLIVGGKKARLHEFPHMALVGYETGGTVRWLCGGSLISDEYVLTAAHCVSDRTLGEAKKVRLGVNNKNDITYRQDRTVAQRIKHPDYQPPSQYNDIGLLRLESKVDMVPQVRPACLYTERTISKDRGIASGWGALDVAEATSDDLMKVTLDFANHTFCNHSYRNHISRKLLRGIVDDTQVCAGFLSEKRDTCQGDSGGPFQIYSPKELFCTYQIVGVTSFGKPCGVTRSPGVYTRVSAYIQWIEEIVWPQG